ncbi:hypothetical protein A1QQ_02640 [Vibrio ordalii FF-167]|nr:hypothetical protein A1QQ_02640 [Vibrio ordalii FF-167]OXX63484.1 hypothetical protein B9J89_07290 [Vibrio sp. V15_P4S5T153]
MDLASESERWLYSTTKSGENNQSSLFAHQPSLSITTMLPRDIPLIYNTQTKKNQQKTTLKQKLLK